MSKNNHIISSKEFNKLVTDLNKLHSKSYSPSKDLRPYPTVIESNIPFKDPTTGQNSTLTTDNISKLDHPFCLNLKDSRELIDHVIVKNNVEKNLYNNNLDIDKIENFTFKEHVKFVDMNQMVVLKQGSLITSLMTIHVYPCVAIIAVNKNNNTIGLAHIPGSPMDELISWQRELTGTYRDPVKYEFPANNLAYKKVNDKTLKNSMSVFLNKVSEENNGINKHNTEIYLLGGNSNRYLLLKVMKLIEEENFNLESKNIYFGQSDFPEFKPNQPFNPNKINKFDIEVNNEEGKIFLLKDLDIFYNDLSTVDQIRNAWDQDNSLISKIDDILGENPTRKEKCNQFDVITLEVIEESQNPEITKFTPYCSNINGKLYFYDDAQSF